MELNKIYNTDCIQFMNRGGIEDDSISLTITDIPYDAINRKSNGLKKLCADVGLADKLTFDIDLFLNELYRITSSTIIIFCGKEQMSNIYKFFANKQNNGLGTVRQIIWEKLILFLQMANMFIFLELKMQYGLESVMVLLMLFVRIQYFVILLQKIEFIQLKRIMNY